jgi:L-ribulose-5-phosphate 3-epimerase
MQICGHDIGVCGWSLQPRDTADLIGKVKELGLEHFQLGLGSLLGKEASDRGPDIDLLRKSGLTITATSISFPGEDYSSVAMIRRTGGFVPEAPWPQRRELSIRAAQLTAELGIKSLEFHVGFVPSSSDPAYNVLVERVREIGQAAVKLGVDLLMETGQESGSELLQFLNDLNCRNTGVNYDPANMILYGTDDPIDAVAILSRHIRHVHLKDAVASSQPRMQWGKEVPLGGGEVGVERFLDALDEINYTGVLSIEREAGNDRMGDIRAAIQTLRAYE